MKKAALSLLAFGLIGVGAFADGPTVTIGDWGRQLTAIGSSADGYWLAAGSSWGNPGARIVGLNIQAKTDNAGFSITPSADNGSFGLTDQNKAWISPMAGLTIETGIDIETDTWRGSDGFGSWNWVRFNAERGDNVTFSRLGNNGSGMQTAVNYNKDGIGVWADVNLSGKLTGTPLAANTGTSNLGDALQAGAAYTIAGIGQVKAQYLGFHSNAEGFATQYGSKGSGTAYGDIQAAFNLSAVKNLSLEAAIQLPTASKDAGYTYQFSAVAGYTLDKTAFHLEVIDISYTDDHAPKAGTGLAGGLGVDYDLGDGLGVGGDIRYANAFATQGGGDTTNIDPFTGFFVGVTKGFSNGLIGIGFEYATKGYGFSFGNADPTAGNWVIPVRLEEWF